MPGLKETYRRIFNKSQRDKIYVWRRRMAQAVESFFSGTLNLLPAGAKVFIKSHLDVKGRLDYAHKTVWLDLSTPLELEVRRRSCAKEPETVLWIERFFKSGDVFWDIGANVGAYSLVASKFLDGKTKVYAFEPSFANFSQLCRNIALNHCGDSIIPLNIALSRQTQIGTFNYQSLVPGSALHSLGEAVDFKNETFVPLFRQHMMSFSPDDLLGIFRLPVPQHIKLDVDGIEMEILQGAPEILGAPGVRSILVEVDEQASSIIDFLGRFGFRVHERHAQGAQELAMFNYIFVKGS